jgi:hypothetical protein
MRHSTFYLALLALAGLVGGISLDILRYLHWLVLSYVVIVPVWITLPTVLVPVARVWIFCSASAVLGNNRALFTKESTSIMVGRRFGEPQRPQQT